MQRRFILATALAVVLCLIVALPALAQGDGPGKMVLGGQYTLRSGQQLDGDLGILGGSATLEEGSLVNGDVLLAGGSLLVSGAVDGDIVMFGGGARLTSGAQVDGDVVTLGGQFTQEPGAVVTGEVRKGAEFSFPGRPGTSFLPWIQGVPTASPGQTTPYSPLDWLAVLFVRVLRAIGLALALGALALVVALFWPKGVQTIGRTIEQQPALALVLGLATWIIALTVGVVMLITICLTPAALALALALIVAGLLAWIAAGWLVGNKLLAILKVRNQTPVLEATIGTLILVSVYLLLSLLPCLDFIFGLAVASLGLGALMLTRFGTRPYTPAGRAVSEPLPPALPPAGQPTQAVAPIATAHDVGLTPAAVERAAEITKPPVIAGTLGEPIPAPGSTAIVSAEDIGLPPAAGATAQDPE